VSSASTVQHSNTPLTAPIKEERANILGVGVHALNVPRAVELIESAILEGRRGYVCVTGVHGVMEAQRDPQFREILDRALIVTPDGMPTVWLGRLQGLSQMRRVFGPQLMSELCRRSPKKHFTHFLYGGKAGVAQELRRNLEHWFPGIRVVGTFTPPFRPLLEAEQAELEELVAKLKPDIIWVGLSTPKQERFMSEFVPRMASGVMIGVGAAFDIHTGRLKDAPDWVKSAGLQWLHRLGQEPSRLWKRYLVNNSRFLWRTFLQCSGLVDYKLPPG
jgi:N-acetylglucosaminyldiphosphoundecaprenol N-acetyl-beta-D-mannosaminyltransferase